VVGVNGIGLFLGDDDISTAAMVRHILYYIDLIGPAHIGIGIDYFHDTSGDANTDEDGDDFNATLGQNINFWPPAQYPGGTVRCAAPSQLIEIAEALLAKGVPNGDVEGILGGNFRRVAEQVWR
jgi:membrane dipeptidase